jgi:hypothetical protein
VPSLVRTDVAEPSGFRVGHLRRVF